MSTWLIVLLCYLLFGVACFFCMMHFFPPNDEPPPHVAARAEESGRDLGSNPMPFSFVSYLIAVPGLVLFSALAPFLLVLFIWQRAKDKHRAKS